MPDVEASSGLCETSAKDAGDEIPERPADAADGEAEDRPPRDTMESEAHEKNLPARPGTTQAGNEGALVSPETPTSEDSLAEVQLQMNTAEKNDPKQASEELRKITGTADPTADGAAERIFSPAVGVSDEKSEYVRSAILTANPGLGPQKGCTTVPLRAGMSSWLVTRVSASRRFRSPQPWGCVSVVRMRFCGGLVYDSCKRTPSHTHKSREKADNTRVPGRFQEDRSTTQDSGAS